MPARCRGTLDPHLKPALNYPHVVNGNFQSRHKYIYNYVFEICTHHPTAIQSFTSSCLSSMNASVT